MEKVRPWCGQPSDRGRLRNRTERTEPPQDCAKFGWSPVSNVGEVMMPTRETC